MSSLSSASKSVLAIACLQAVIITGLEVYLFFPFLNEISQAPAQKLLVYIACFIFAMLFQIYLCFDATKNQNTIEVIAFVGMNFGSFAYSVLFASRREQDSDVLIDQLLGDKFLYISVSVCVVTFLASLMFGYVSMRLFREFGWKIYKKIGADPKMRDMYRAYHNYLLILKLDFFFFLTFSVQLAVLILQSTDIEQLLTLAAVGVIPVLLIFAVIGLRRESKTLMSLVFVGFLAGMAYFIFKLYRMYTDKKNAYAGNIRYMTFLGICSLLLTIASIIFTIICSKNFNKGLKQHVSKSSRLSLSSSSSDRKAQSFELD